MKMKILVFVCCLAFLNLQAQTSLDTATNFTVKDVNGMTYHLNDILLQKKIVVLDFFTTTCGPCITYAPLISESYNHFGCNGENVVFLGINWGGDNAGVRNFGQTYGVEYPEVSGAEGNGNHVVEEYGVGSFPTVIMILPNWYIAEKYIWPPTTEHIDSIIASYGGVLGNCLTGVNHVQTGRGRDDRILSVNSVNALDLVSCAVTGGKGSMLDVYSFTGYRVIEGIKIEEGKTVNFSVQGLGSGCYLIVMRDIRGRILDRKPFVVR